MTGKNKKSPHFQQIKPTSFEFESLGESPQPSAITDESMTKLNSSRPGYNNYFVVITIVALCLLLIFVVFFLPALIPESQQIGPEESAETLQEKLKPSSQGLNSPFSSPFKEAKDKRERRQAQDILEPLLDKKLELESVGVELWGNPSFTEAIEGAEAGDALYRAGEFSAAIDQYSEALKKMELLDKSFEPIKQALLEEGEQSLLSNQHEKAEAAFTTVLRMQASNTEALTGLKRLAVADELHNLLAKGANFEASADYSSAVKQYAEAVALDKDSVTAREAFTQAGELQSKAQFSNLMSQGYQALSSGQQTLATKAFKKALVVQPDSTEAKEALAQANGQQTLQSINRYFQRARHHEAGEAWAEAVAAYSQALKVDGNLLEARQKKKYAQQRLKLGLALAKINANPLSLSNSPVYSNARKVYAAARKVQAPGPNLQQQMQLLDAHLKSSQQQVSVLIKSDGYTQVVVQKVARLGTLNKYELDLKPGKYVVSGSRNGYRDIRKEFVVPISSVADSARRLSTQQIVEVSCVETI